MTIGQLTDWMTVGVENWPLRWRVSGAGKPASSKWNTGRGTSWPVTLISCSWKYASTSRWLRCATDVLGV